MILSILKLSRSDCNTLKIKDIYSLHKTVYSLFPLLSDSLSTKAKEKQSFSKQAVTSSNGRDFLFVDKGGDFHGREIMILSSCQPALPKYGKLSSKKIPETFMQMDHYFFEVVLNPVKREIRTGRLIAVRGTESLLKWFIDKLEHGELGFKVSFETLQVNHEGVLRYQKNGTTCTHNTATFKGKLTVIDRSRFVKTFEHGIGRAKCFGFGLLQIIPINVENN